VNVVFDLNGKCRDEKLIIETRWFVRKDSFF